MGLGFFLEHQQVITPINREIVKTPLKPPGQELPTKGALQIVASQALQGAPVLWVVLIHLRTDLGTKCQ